MMNFLMDEMDSMSGLEMRPESLFCESFRTVRSLFPIGAFLKKGFPDESLGGLYRSPRIQLPPPSPIVATQGPMTFHNINVQGSVVGAINTGEVQRIDVAIDHIRLGGDPALAQSLTQFTEALLADAELQEEAKKEILEQLSFLSTQTATPKEQRKPGMIRAVLEGIGKAAAVSTALITLWERLHPLLAKALF
jgi:hypothetical protein